MQAAIRIQEAVKIYQNGFAALKGVSFDVAQGEFFGLLGPNGAGKTTLISAMAGLGRLTSGCIEVMGYDVVREPYAARMNLGVVPQELVFDPFFTVREALQFQSGYFGLNRNDAWIDEVIHHLGLDDKANTNTRNLSGGMKRRVMVAQALVHRPPVIVLDEPTAGVDVELRQSLWTFIQKLNQQGHTIILTTHYLEEAQNLCDRIAMMKQGELVALDSTQHLLHDEAAGVMVKLVLDGELPECLRPWRVMQRDEVIELKLEDYQQLTWVLQTLMSDGIAVKSMQLPENDLEAVFVRIMGGG